MSSKFKSIWFSILSYQPITASQELTKIRSTGTQSARGFLEARRRVPTTRLPFLRSLTKQPSALWWLTTTEFKSLLRWALFLTIIHPFMLPSSSSKNHSTPKRANSSTQRISTPIRRCTRQLSRSSSGLPTTGSAKTATCQ